MKSESESVRIWVAMGYRGINLELKIDGEWTGLSLNEYDVRYLQQCLTDAQNIWGDRPLVEEEADLDES